MRFWLRGNAKETQFEAFEEIKLFLTMLKYLKRLDESKLLMEITQKLSSSTNVMLKVINKMETFEVEYSSKTTTQFLS